MAALVLLGRGLECGCHPLSSIGEAMCLAAGALTGIGVTWRAHRAAGARRQRWFSTMLIASVTATLGCVGSRCACAPPSATSAPRQHLPSEPMSAVKTIALFVVTAVAEIVGCYLPYLWLRHGRPW